MAFLWTPPNGQSSQRLWWVPKRINLLYQKGANVVLDSRFGEMGQDRARISVRAEGWAGKTPARGMARRDLGLAAGG